METVELGSSMPRPITIQDIPETECGKRALEIALTGSHPIVFVYTTGGPAPELVRVGKAMADKARIPFHGWAVPSCPCGNYGSVMNECRCTLAAILKYRRRIGIRLGEFDIVVEIIAPRDATVRKGEAEEHIMERVLRARAEDLKVDDKLGSDSMAMMKLWQSDCGSGRVEQALRVAKTITRLQGETRIQVHCLVEGIQYQTLAGLFPGQPEVELKAEVEK